MCIRDRYQRRVHGKQRIIMEQEKEKNALGNLKAEEVVGDSKLAEKDLNALKSMKASKPKVTINEKDILALCAEFETPYNDCKQCLINNEGDFAKAYHQMLTSYSQAQSIQSLSLSLIHI
eukprot:TRINITY_DN3371_c0_g1_i1.p1 TRINITY_DN3371_c0_g1~~TRINITY_DN3371_c0_g1_i1.p1  ORF type:complete len:120 (-),score=26.58 TRINITY_DN3371_c0_g1_i1:164-523(-)